MSKFAAISWGEQVTVKSSHIVTSIKKLHVKDHLLLFCHINFI